MMFQFASCIVAIPRKSQVLELGEGDPQRSNVQLRYKKIKDEGPGSGGLVMVCGDVMEFIIVRIFGVPTGGVPVSCCCFLLVVVDVVLVIRVIQHPLFLVYAHHLCSMFPLCFCCSIALYNWECEIPSAIGAVSTGSLFIMCTNILQIHKLKGPQQNLQPLPNNIMLRLFVKATKFPTGTDVHMKL